MMKDTRRRVRVAWITAGPDLSGSSQCSSSSAGSVSSWGRPISAATEEQRRGRRRDARCTGWHAPRNNRRTRIANALADALVPVQHNTARATQSRIERATGAVHTRWILPPDLDRTARRVSRVNDPAGVERRFYRIARRAGRPNRSRGQARFRPRFPQARNRRFGRLEAGNRDELYPNTSVPVARTANSAGELSPSPAVAASTSGGLRVHADRRAELLHHPRGGEDEGPNEGTRALPRRIHLTFYAPVCTCAAKRVRVTVCERVAHTYMHTYTSTRATYTTTGRFLCRDPEAPQPWSWISQSFGTVIMCGGCPRVWGVAWQ